MLTICWVDVKWGRVKTERVFPGLSVLRKNNKMEVLSPEKWKYYSRKNKNKKGKIGPTLERSPAISAEVFSGNSTSKMRLTRGDIFPGTVLPKCAWLEATFFSGNSTSKTRELNLTLFCSLWNWKMEWLKLKK